MFLTTMAQSGRIALGHPEADPADLPDLLEQDAVDREAAHRLDLVSPPPPFDVPTALWASTLLYKCCQFLIYRDLGPQLVAHAFAQLPPDRALCPNPSNCYSADVAFSYLPDVYHLARGIAPGDPLVVGLQQLARQWPLSSVGIPDLTDLDITPFIDHPCLRELYLCRIVSRHDRTRLHHPTVLASLRQAVGAYPELAGDLSPALAKEKP